MSEKKEYIQLNIKLPKAVFFDFNRVKNLTEQRIDDKLTQVKFFEIMVKKTEEAIYND
jgi:hypothetical protein